MGWRRGATLGKGSFGVVSLAHTEPQSKSDHAAVNLTNTPPLFAVKSASISQYQSLHKERKMLSQFQDCPYILGCYGFDVTREKGNLFYNLLLEYASGGSLIDRIRSCCNSGGGVGRGLPECDVKRYTKMILLGLSHIHHLGYVHCDLKPHNILIAKQSLSNSCPCSDHSMIDEETIKIGDFGLAKRAGGGGGGKKPVITKQEKGDSRKLLSGTPLYMAPETVRESEYEPHCDIWALGCTVLHMFTGKPAWNCDDKNNPLDDVLYRIGFTALMPKIPFWITTVAMDFMSKCLVRDPKKRWTADMLLRHPFVSCLSICDDNFMMLKEEEIRNRPVITFADDGDRLDDLPKPNLLMLTVGGGESFDDLPKPNLLMLDARNANCGVSVLLKRKRAAAAADDAEEGGCNNRYWCSKRISSISDLCDAVPLGF